MDLSSRELRSLKAVHRDQDRSAAPVVGDFRWGKTTGFKPVMATLDFTQNFTQKFYEFLQIFVAMISIWGFHDFDADFDRNLGISPKFRGIAAFHWRISPWKMGNLTITWRGFDWSKHGNQLSAKWHGCTRLCTYVYIYIYAHIITLWIIDMIHIGKPTGAVGWCGYGSGHLGFR